MIPLANPNLPDFTKFQKLTPDGRQLIKHWQQFEAATDGKTKDYCLDKMINLLKDTIISTSPEQAYDLLGKLERYSSTLKPRTRIISKSQLDNFSREIKVARNFYYSMRES